MGRKIKARHTIVREQCLVAHGSPEAAIDAALAALRTEALGIINGWGRPLECRLHFTVELERPPLDPLPGDVT